MYHVHYMHISLWYAYVHHVSFHVYVAHGDMHTFFFVCVTWNHAQKYDFVPTPPFSFSVARSTTTSLILAVFLTSGKHKASDSAPLHTHGTKSPVTSPNTVVMTRWFPWRNLRSCDHWNYIDYWVIMHAFLGMKWKALVVTAAAGIERIDLSWSNCTVTLPSWFLFMKHIFSSYESTIYSKFYAWLVAYW